jgi:predicted O-methyltransferase YrrM
MRNFQFFFRYIRHIFNAKTKFGIHSPFIYNLVSNIFKKKIPKNISGKIKLIRKNLLQDKRVLEITDFGAGSLSNKSNKRIIKEIARNSLSTNKFLNLLFQLIQYNKPDTIIELGTSLGLSSSIMAMAANESTIYTLEGCPNIANIAKENFDKLHINNIELRIGEFSETIPKILKNIKKADFVFFDGNHRKQATIDYFNTFLPYKTNESIFIFDDIYWSIGMEEAWNYIKDHPEVIVSIDLFFLGIVFFRKELSTEHLIYRF